MRTADSLNQQPRFISTGIASTVAMLLMVASLTVPASASANEDALAVVYIEASAISFVPRVEAEGWVLDVTNAAGVLVTLEFSGSETPVLEFADSKRRLADGTYSYTLRPSPAIPDVREQSGTFSLEEGEIVYGPAEPGTVVDLRNMLEPSGAGAPSARPSAPAAQQVFNGNVVVLSSLCVGFDCTNNPSFGFTTLGLAENNLRVQFHDTSSAASFPRTDWMIQINDSANGGASFFGVIDCGDNAGISGCNGDRVFWIKANAPSNSLVVDDSGDVGFGTATPVVEVHTRGGDTPTLRLEQDGSSGFAPQTWDVAGNETNFFVRDVTNGSTLPFRIRPGAPTSSIDIDGDGEVGIGTAAPDAQLDIDVGSVDRVGLKVSGQGGSTVSLQELFVDSTRAARFLMNDVERQFYIDAFDNGTSYGPNVFIDRNNNAATPASGQLAIRNRNDQMYIFWPDAAGNLRIHTTTATSVNDLAGSVVGDQTSWHSYKVYEPWNEEGALETVVGTDLYRFRYINTGYQTSDGGAPSFYGLVGFDRDDWFLKNVGPRQVPAINELTLFGHLIASVKSLNHKVETQQQAIDDLTARLMALEATIAGWEKR